VIILYSFVIPGRARGLRPSSPLRTVRDSFPSYGSSISKAVPVEQPGCYTSCVSIFRSEMPMPMQSQNAVTIFHDSLAASIVRPQSTKTTIKDDITVRCRSSFILRLRDDIEALSKRFSLSVNGRFIFLIILIY
jgi:hypothetical protein